MLSCTFSLVPMYNDTTRAYKIIVYRSRLTRKTVESSWSFRLIIQRAYTELARRIRPELCIFGAAAAVWVVFRPPFNCRDFGVDLSAARPIISFLFLFFLRLNITQITRITTYKCIFMCTESCFPVML